MFAKTLLRSLAMTLLGASSVFAQVDERKPVSDHTLIVNVVDAATRKPVADAEVICLSHEETVADWSKKTVTGDLADWEEARERLGHRTKTDAKGRTQFERPNGTLYLYASAPSRWTQYTLQPDTQGPIELWLSPDSTLDVAVVDESGAACGGVAVSIFSSFADETGESDVPDDRFESFADCVATMTSGEKDGIAHFRHIQTYVRKEERKVSLVRLSIPLAKSAGARFDPEHANDAHPKLVVPPTGSVSIACAEVPTGTARLRRSHGSSLGGAMFNPGEPLQAPIVDGHAVFPRVGLGIELDYQLTGPNLTMALFGKFSGPTRAGERVEFETPTDETLPVLVGRAIDEDSHPIANAQMSCSVSIETDGGGGSTGSACPTDAAGRFRFVLRQSEVPPGGHRFVSFGIEGAASRPIELSERLSAGPHECGDVMLIPIGSTRWLERMSDEELEKHYRETRDSPSRDIGRVREVETCLQEIARRGGKHWEKFLSDELARVRANKDEVEDLERLTVLRRAQRKPDPLTLELDGGLFYECRFPDAPIVSLHLKNVDQDRDSFTLSVGGSYRGGRFARCRVDAIDADGKRVEPLPSPGMMGGGMFTRRVFEPGRSLDFGLPLGAYVQFPHAGEFRVRIDYHDQQDIDGETDAKGWIVSSSPTFTVRVLPLKVQLTKQELAQFREWIAKIDVNQPVALVSGHWNDALRFEGDAKSPEDRLFRAGWKSMPALLDALADLKLDPKRRSWVLGMLWNISGSNNPTGNDAPGAIGAYKWIETWPGSNQKGEPSMAEFGDQPDMSIWPESQKKLSDRWLALKNLVELKVVE